MAFRTGSSGDSNIKRKAEMPPLPATYNLTSGTDPNIRAQSDEVHAMKLKIKVRILVTYLVQE